MSPSALATSVKSRPLSGSTSEAQPSAGHGALLSSCASVCTSAQPPLLVCTAAHHKEPGIRNRQHGVGVPGMQYAHSHHGISRTGRCQQSNGSRGTCTWKQATHVRSIAQRFAGACVDGSNGEALRVVQIWQHCKGVQHLHMQVSTEGPISDVPYLLTM